ncbi:MAG TPA: hypothetical protein VMT62_17825 [Syntrophorhabdaceae bacterium]|nr:hypothetical protein [Syntrophorhabdaceae bacterium]
MKNVLLVCSLVLFALCFGTTLHAATPVKVDVLYMNHGPLMDTINKMKATFSAYGNQLAVSWYDFDTQEGEKFMAKMGINQHVPLVVWIDGKQKWTVGTNQITFSGFPTGSGPSFFQGKWTLDDLKSALNQATGKK